MTAQQSMTPDQLSTTDAAQLTEWVDSAIHGRRSVRAYRSDPVPETDLEAILESGRWAPSPHNAEPWRFAVLRGMDAKQRLAQAMGQRWTDDLTRDGWTPEAIAQEIEKSHGRIAEAPVVVIVCISADGLDAYPDPKRQQAELMMAAHSVGSAVQNMMLTAYSRGLATGWMCAPLFCPEVVVGALDLPGDLTPQGLITIGYPVAWPKLRRRRSMTDLIIDVA